MLGDLIFYSQTPGKIIICARAYYDGFFTLSNERGDRHCSLTSKLWKENVKNFVSECPMDIDG